MVQHRDFLAEIPAQDLSQSSPEWLTKGRETNVDCETAMQLRAYLGPLFSKAQSWTDLSRLLSEKGFALVFREARLVLTDTATGRHICTSRYLGSPLRELVERLGRPCVRLTSRVSGVLAI